MNVSNEWYAVLVSHTHPFPNPGRGGRGGKEGLVFACTTFRASGMQFCVHFLNCLHHIV